MQLEITNREAYNKTNFIISNNAITVEEEVNTEW